MDILRISFQECFVKHPPKMWDDLPRGAVSQHKWAVWFEIVWVNRLGIFFIYAQSVTLPPNYWMAIWPGALVIFTLLNGLKVMTVKYTEKLMAFLCFEKFLLWPCIILYLLLKPLQMHIPLFSLYSLLVGTWNSYYI